jgi:hypothetical protein
LVIDLIKSLILPQCITLCIWIIERTLLTMIQKDELKHCYTSKLKENNFLKEFDKKIVPNFQINLLWFASAAAWRLKSISMIFLINKSSSICKSTVPSKRKEKVQRIYIYSKIVSKSWIFLIENMMKKIKINFLMTLHIILWRKDSLPKIGRELPMHIKGSRMWAALKWKEQKNNLVTLQIVWNKSIWKI